MSNLVVFAGSQEIQDKILRSELENTLNVFLDSNKEKIDHIFFGGQIHWVMWMVNAAANQLNIDITWYSLEKYRKYDEWNWVDLQFFDDDYLRVREFTEKWDVFLGLPGWEWTIRELGFVTDNIWLNDWKYVFISHLFKDYVNLLNSLKSKNMLSSHDIEMKQIIDIANIRI